MASIDYIQTPPVEYQTSRPVLVEFVTPEIAPLRCIERGIKTLAYACGNTDFLTMPNPCATQGQSYSKMLCHELARANGWGTSD